MTATWAGAWIQEVSVFYTLVCTKNNPMKKWLLVCFVLLSISSLTMAQTKTTEDVNQLWFGYYNQVRFSNKWGLWVDLHLRTKEEFVNSFSQSILRGGLTYYISDATKLTAGYAYVSI